MSTVTINGFDISDWSPTGKTVEFWIVSQKAWLTSTNTIKLSGNLTQLGVVKRVSCTENPTTRILSVSLFGIDSTTDAVRNPNVKYLGVLVTVNNNRATVLTDRSFDILPNGFKVPPTFGNSSVYDIDNLVTYNSGYVPNADLSAFSRSETLDLISRVSARISTVNNPVLSGLTTPNLPTALGALQLDLLTGLTSIGNGTAAIPLTPSLNVRMYPFNAKGDGVKTTASIQSGQATLTLTSGSFTSANIGNLVDVAGAGAGGKNLVKTITAVVAGVATLSGNASTTVVNATTLYGTDDRAAIQACITKALSLGKGVYCPLSKYIIGSPGLAVTSDGMSLSGDGMWASQMYSIGPVEGSSGTYFSIIDLQAGKFNLRSIGLSGTNWLGAGLALGGTSDGLGALAGIANSDVLIESCRFDSFFGIGCHAAGNQQRWKIANSQGSLNGSSAFNVNVDDLQMVNCTGTDNATGGIESSGAAASVMGGTYSRNRNAGISIGGRTGVGDTGRLNKIIGVTIERNQQGIVVASNNQMTVVGLCTIRQNDTIGIAISNTETSPTASYANRLNLIEGNIISSNGCTLAGASIAGVLTGTAGHGIFCASPYNLIQNNYIFDEGITNFTQNYGIHVETATDGVRVLRNHVTGSANADYLFDGATNLLFDNVVATSTISAVGTTFLYPSQTIDRLTIRKKESLVIEVIAEADLNPFDPADRRAVQCTLTANRTFDSFNGTDGQLMTLIFIQDGSGGHTLGYGGSERGMTNIAGGQAAGKVNTQTMIFRTGPGWIAYTPAVQNI